MMRLGGTRRLVIAASIAISAQVACDSPTAPTPVPAGYAGEWTGTTQHGTPIRFSVSAADEVTSFTVTYNFSVTCSGTLTYTDLAVPIRKQEPPGPPPFDQPGFAFGRMSDDRVSATAINGVFSAERRSASGQFALVGYSGCGPSVLGTRDARRC
jgi:hypothetical protein